MLHCFCPFRLLEADQNEVVGDEHRALDEHSVRCEQGVHLVLGHAGELMSRAQLGLGGLIVLDVPKLVGSSVCVKPFLRLLAGAAFGIAKKDHVIDLLYK